MSEQESELNERVAVLSEAMRHAQELFDRARDLIAEGEALMEKALAENQRGDPRAAPRPGQATVKSRKPHRYITLYVAEALLDELDDVAARSGAKRPVAIRQALQQFVDGRRTVQAEIENIAAEDVF